MSYGMGSLGGGFGGNFGNQYNLICHLSKYIGDTVTIFTTSGGASGCGFTGILLSVNCNFVRISTLQGTPPANPLSPVICGGGCNNTGAYGAGSCNCNQGYSYRGGFRTGSVCDIPIQWIASFCHTAV